MADYIDWMGRSGRLYRYWFVAVATATGIKADAGNYAFVKQLANGNFVPLYFGQAVLLNARLPNHERWAEAVRLGATHMMGHTTPGGESVRCAEEQELIGYWDPPLNTQHRSAM